MKQEIIAPGVEIYCGDCLDILPWLKVDAVITDPPYEDVMQRAVGKFARLRSDGKTGAGAKRKGFGFDAVDGIRDETARLCCQASAGWVILFTLAEGVRAWRDAVQAAGGKYDTCLAWIKPDSAPRFNGQGAARGFECAVTAWAGTGYRRWNGGGKRGVYTFPCNPPDRTGLHPTEKPVALMSALLADYTNPGQTVLDPFAGSGTTGVAAIRLGRHFIGIENNPEYYDAARRRLTKALEQPDFFVNIPAPMEPADA